MFFMRTVNQNWLGIPRCFHATAQGRDENNWEVRAASVLAQWVLPHCTLGRTSLGFMADYRLEAVRLHNRPRPGDTEQSLELQALSSTGMQPEQHPVQFFITPNTT